MPLAVTIKQLVSFILKGVDLIDNTSIEIVSSPAEYLTTLLGYLKAGDTLVGKTLKRFRLERIMKEYTI